MTTPTSKPIPSEDVRDLKFNSGKIDEVVNSSKEKYTDRFGVERFTLEGIRNNISPLGKTYTLAQANAAIASGEIPNEAYFFVWSDNPDYIAEKYQNVNGVATPAGQYIISGGSLIASDGNGNLVALDDVDSKRVFVVDDFGGVNISGLDGTLQENAETISANKGPYLNLLTDADNAAYGSIDEYGHLHLPDMQSSIQDMLKSHQTKIENVIKNRKVLDVRDCGFNPSTGENSLYAIQRAINYLSGAGGGVVYLPEGKYPLSSFILPRSNVSIIGAGADKTVLLPYKAAAAIRYLGNPSSYLQNMIMSDFTIDGENQTLNPSQGFLPEIKGTFIQYWKDIVMDKLKFLNTGATSIGNDMPFNCSIMRCYVENFGRLAPNASSAGIWERPLGSSGIGLGTGALDDEPIYVAFNTVKTGANFGLFFEPQAGGAARGAVAIGNILEGGYAGLADCGIDGLQAISNQMRLNKYGILRYPGTNASGKPGRRGQFIGNIVESNTSHGIYSYMQTAKNDPLVGGNIFSNNQVRSNGEDGFNFRYENPSVQVANETIDGNHISENGRHGVHIESGSLVLNMDISNNKIWNNGKAVAGNAIHSVVPMTMCSITLNKIRDTQSTKTQQFTINISGDLTDVDISFNHCVGNAQNSLNLTGAQTRVTTNFNAGI
ncbi:right-handed parallel beta-helix repeat-containing protein [Serratia marcescens]|nr:right-handed parallel beta-helix repeat-containing protein [Serratia marcescens]